MFFPKRERQISVTVSDKSRKFQKLAAAYAVNKLPMPAKPMLTEAKMI